MHFPILTYERKSINLPRSMQFAWHPTEILLRLVVRCSAYRFSFESAFTPFSIGTEILPLSSLNPPIPHISVGRLFNFQGSRKFNLPYIPRHKESQIFQKNKNFLKFFHWQKRQKKIRPSRMYSRKPFCYMFSYTLVRLSISLCTFSSITFFFLEIAL